MRTSILTGVWATLALGCDGTAPPVAEATKPAPSAKATAKSVETSAVPPVERVPPAAPVPPPVAPVAPKPPGASPKPVEPEVPAAPAEDPEVAAYFKAKRWEVTPGPIDFQSKEVFYRLHMVEPVAPQDIPVIAKSRVIQYLFLNQDLTDADLAPIAKMPRLASLYLRGEAMTDAGAAKLADCPTLRFLHFLGTKKVTDAGIRPLAKLPKLESLKIEYAPVTGSFLPAFADSRTLSRLELVGCEGFGGEDAARAIATMPKLDGLKIVSAYKQDLPVSWYKAATANRLPADLSIPTGVIEDELLAHLVAKGWLYGPPTPAKPYRPLTADKVLYLDLERSRITDKSIPVLTAAYLNLSVLRLAVAEKLTDQGIVVLAKGWPKLKSLNLGRYFGSGVTYGEPAYMAIGTLTELTELDLFHQYPKPGWLKHLAGLSHLTKLEVGAFTDDDAAALSGLPELQTLTLNETSLGDRGLDSLLKLPKLKTLFADKTKITPKAVLTAKQTHPKVAIHGSQFK